MTTFPPISFSFFFIVDKIIAKNIFKKIPTNQGSAMNASKQKNLIKTFWVFLAHGISNFCAHLTKC